MTQEERELAGYAGEDYVNQYAVQAGLAGAAGGALVGCVLFEVLGNDCATGAIAGGALGGLGGAVWGAEQGRETERLAERQLTAEQALAIAESELESAQESNEAASAVVSQQQVRLAVLRSDLASGRAGQTEAEEALKEARRAQALIGGSSAKLADSLQDVKDRIAREKKQGEDPSKLEETYRDMQRAETELNSQLATLQGEIELTESILTS